MCLLQRGQPTIIHRAIRTTTVVPAGTNTCAWTKATADATCFLPTPATSHLCHTAARVSPLEPL